MSDWASPRRRNPNQPCSVFFPFQSISAPMSAQQPPAVSASAPPPPPQRRRQQRLHLSCSECRRRKTRCDRGKPCLPCVRGDRAQICRYDYHPSIQEQSAPGQLVFEVRPAQEQQRRRIIPRQVSRSSSPSGSDRVERHPKNVTSTTATVGERGASQILNEGITPLRQFWHGSRAGDRYVSPFDRQAIVVPKEVISGEDDATVFWGRTHEANFVPRITDMTTLLLKPAEDDDISTLLEVERHTRPKNQVPPGLDAELLALVPPRTTADRLWRIYETHFDSYYRVLHIPTFESEYQSFWAAQQGSRHFLPQLLSICAIASCFRDEDRLHLQEQVRIWIEAVRMWLFKADPRSQLTLGYLQAHLLMLIAGDVHWIKIDRSWISSGALIRTAISAGLHREPRDFFRISPFHAEIRRRLWYSILEYDLLASFAKGRIPNIRQDEYDCNLPSSNWHEYPPGTLHGPATTSEQISVIVAEALPLRRHVCHAINSISLTIEYDEVLRLDAELQNFLRKVVNAADHAPRPTSAFQRVLCSILSQRALIALHAPFVTRALHDPKWSYSRARCLETAKGILEEALTLLDDTTAGGDCGRFSTITNICRCEISNSVFLVCHELLAQAAERRGLVDHLSLAGSLAGVEAGGEAERRAVLVQLVDRTAAALERVSKSDVVSQRTCAWVRLSAQLCRAAMSPEEASTIPAIKEVIKRGTQDWLRNRQAHETVEHTAHLDAVVVSILKNSSSRKAVSGGYGCAHRFQGREPTQLCAVPSFRRSARRRRKIACTLTLV